MHFFRTLPIRRTCLEAGLVLGLWAWAGLVFAYSRMGDAEVRMQDGQPCFTITQNEAARAGAVRLQAVSLADPYRKPVRDFWKLVFDAASPPTIPPAGCVVYGQAVDGAKGAPAPALQDGKVYEVYINGRTSDASDPTRGYQGRFCLQQDGVGARRVLAVSYGTRAWRDGVCE